MEEIFVVESGEIDGRGEVENLWKTMHEAVSYINALLMNEEYKNFKRIIDKEDDRILRYWDNGSNYICIKGMVIQ